MIQQSIRRRQHAGPRNIHVICGVHIEENGPRPSAVGLKGEEKKQAVAAQKHWDGRLMARSPIIAQAINNDVCIINGNGMVVPKPRK
jgi:hypothetical protein